MVLRSLCVLSRSRRLSCVFCRDPGDCLSLVPVWFGRFGFQKDFWLVMESDWLSNAGEEVLGVGPGQGRKNLAEAITVDARKEWTCKFCSESNVMTRWRCRRCYSNIPAWLHGKHRQAVAAKSGDWSTGLSVSSGEEDRKARSLDAENKELRARIDAVEKKEHKKGPVSFSETRRGLGRSVGIAWKSRMRPSAAENWMNR